MTLDFPEVPERDAGPVTVFVLLAIALAYIALC